MAPVAALMGVFAMTCALPSMKSACALASVPAVTAGVPGVALPPVAFVPVALRVLPATLPRAVDFTVLPLSVRVESVMSAALIRRPPSVVLPTLVVSRLWRDASPAEAAVRVVTPSVSWLVTSLALASEDTVLSLSVRAAPLTAAGVNPPTNISTLPVLPAVTLASATDWLLPSAKSAATVAPAMAVPAEGVATLLPDALVEASASVFNAELPVTAAVMALLWTVSIACSTETSLVFNSTKPSVVAPSRLVTPLTLCPEARAAVMPLRLVMALVLPSLSSFDALLA